MNISQKESVQKEMGRKLKEAREERNLTQAEVAIKADMTVNYYAMIERGEVNPSTDKLRKIVKVLNIKSSDILPF